ncbi:type I secretion system permease/ATPase [Mesorhizobium sp. L-8-10]|uniref:type I secretion system permease/ATPase n=1 Tax=Mesorhizobium sp. L-8-10 TaxID=2744523 RepID=UPI001FD0FF06|nr:type I secretion system permease/ATPase [Mesorhizobium sp. L-8-10]
MTPSISSGSSKNPFSTALARSRAALTFVAFYSGAINVLTLTGSLFMLQVYDRVLPSGSVDTLVALVVIVAFLYSVQAVLETVRTRMLTRVSRRLDEDLSGLAFRSATAPTTAVNGERGDPVRDLDQIRQFFATPGPAALFDLPWMPLYLLISFLFHPWLGWLTVGGATTVLLLAVWGEVRGRAAARNNARTAAQRQNLVDRTRQNAEVLATMNLRARFERRFEVVTLDFLSVVQKGSDRATGMSSAVRALRVLLQSLVLALAAWLAIRGDITMGTIIAASILASRTLAPIDMAVSQWRYFVAARLAAKRLQRSLAESDVREPTTRLPAPHARLEVEDAYVAPPGTRVATLSGVRLSLQAGDGLGIIGPSGSGKTTLVRAITGVWPAMHGEVTLDSAPIAQYSAEDRGAAIGYLPQYVELFDGTIAENIARFDPDRADQAVVRAAQLADIHRMILKLPGGYDTRIGEGGLQLSAGQRQRIGLARAIYGDPFVVVLDEPYSNLDGDGEIALGRTLAGIRARGGIVVVIAHRRSALAAVNKLVVISDGKQMAFGRKEEVLGQVGTMSEAAESAIASERPSNVRVLSHASR